MFAAAALLGVLIILLGVEAIAVRRDVRAIGLRIHINGTRGKSTVAAYTAAAFRASGRSPFAKVTGTRPAILLPDGGREELRRRGPARVQEQFRTIRRAARAGADCLILECMSIDPELQKLESRFFNPDIYILTNIRDDHREVMGRTVDEQAEAILSAIPSDSVVIAVESAFMDRIDAAVRKKNGTLVKARELDARTADRLPDGVFAENVALAAAAAEVAGIGFETAMDAILDSVPEGQEAPIELPGPGGSIRFIDGFPVNDTESAGRFVKYWRKRLSYEGGVTVLLNTRADRPVRTVSFAEWIASGSGISRVIVTGSHASAARRALLKKGFSGEDITVWKEKEVRRARTLLPEICGDDLVVFGLGNISKAGFTIPEILRHGHN